MTINASIPLAGNAERTVNSIIASRQRAVDNKVRDRQLDQTDRQLDLAERRVAGDEAARTTQQRMQETLQRALRTYTDDPSNASARNQLRVLAPQVLSSLDEERRQSLYETNVRNFDLLGRLGRVGDQLTPEQQSFVEQTFGELQAAGELDGVSLADFSNVDNLRALSAATDAVAMTNPLIDDKVRRAIQAGHGRGTEAFDKIVGAGQRDPLVTVNNGDQEKSFDKEIGKIQAKHIGGVLDEAKLARGTLGNVTAMQSILEGVDGDNLETGTLTPFITQAKALGLALGFDLGDDDLRSDVARAQTFTALSMDLVAKARIAETKGSVSNREFDAYIASVAGLSQTVEGNRFMLKMMEKFSRRKMTMGQFAGMVRDKRIDMAEFERRVDTLANQPVMTEEDYAEMERLSLLGDRRTASDSGELPTPQSQADFDALPSGTIFIDPEDGQRYRKP